MRGGEREGERDREGREGGGLRGEGARGRGKVKYPVYLGHNGGVFHASTSQNTPDPLVRRKSYPPAFRHLITGEFRKFTPQTRVMGCYECCLVQY